MGQQAEGKEQRAEGVEKTEVGNRKMGIRCMV